ncbi:ATP-binding protein [Desulforhopalus singaporensis]|uniref:AAA-like domain-containing protein n=1 Tax=Desulforhopalus singaporensis TaxID=91360 RepID=A0A1H0SD99_9BACT|nr:DUF87 domain-containing protein [Desulforhopalus singaporensis]SDP39635.1 AAA-like domain-containing protein [Desulforhopalus singaporensis]
MTQQGYEKLGLFYLGREVSMDSGAESALPLLYKSSHLTTHAAIIGMTGSGKTGLGIALIEEAAIDNIPSVIIDPKGDMGNLLLAFPELQAKDFAPWVDPGEAERRKCSVEEYSKSVADTWRNGLESWGQDGERIRRYCGRTERTIYTPGATAGMPVAVFAGLEAPTKEVATDPDTLNSLIASTVTSVLALVGVSGDPLKSRENILLSSILLYYWQRGENLTLETLIGAVVSPPFNRIGVFALDTFFPQAERMELALLINNIMASPGFVAWTQGEPLDIQRMLYTEEGRPRTSIFSISHLSEPERMFFVTMLLNRFVDWMRRQQGSSSLRALLYMDEIYGYFPPTANPPSKKPMMLLLKQARAYGVGVVLATQNPADLDYKGLSNIGSWFVGRLQTERDRQKVTDGLPMDEGSASRRRVRELLADMKARTFILNSAKMDEPLLFTTRWVMSYLKGPISVSDISRLMADRSVMQPAQQQAPTSIDLRGRGAVSNIRPMVGAGLNQKFLYHPNLTDEPVFSPWLVASCRVRFYNSSRNIDEVRDICLRLPVDSKSHSVAWEESEPFSYDDFDLQAHPAMQSRFAPLPAGWENIVHTRSWEKTFADFHYQNQRLELYRVKSLKLESDPGESQGDFKVRVADLLRCRRDEAVSQLESRYAVKERRLRQRLEDARLRLIKEKGDVTSRTTDTIISFGAAVVGALFGRKKLSATTISKAGTGLRNVGRVAKEKNDVERAEEKVAALELELEELGLELESKIDTFTTDLSIESVEIEPFYITPRRQDIFNLKMFLLWEQRYM